MSTSGCSDSGAPAAGPAPRTRLATPAGRPASSNARIRQSRGRRRQLTRLEHERVARQQGRGHLPDRLQQRVIPRGDQSADADRLVDQAADRIRPAGVHHASGIGAADAGVVAQARQRRRPCRTRPRRSACRCRALRRGRSPCGRGRSGRRCAATPPPVRVRACAATGPCRRLRAPRRSRPRCPRRMPPQPSRPADRLRDIGFRGGSPSSAGAIHPRCTNSPALAFPVPLAVRQSGPLCRVIRNPNHTKQQTDRAEVTMSRGRVDSPKCARSPFRCLMRECPRSGVSDCADPGCR